MFVYVPARGGSKGIPLKNIHPFLGKPLIAYTFDIINKMVKLYPGEIVPFLSTDDNRIQAYGMQYGFSNDYLRPESLSDDKANIVDGIIHALEWLEAEKNIIPDEILLLQPTSPLRTISQVQALLQAFRGKNAQSMFSVIPMKQHPFECINCSGDQWDYVSKPAGEVSQRQSYLNRFYFIDGSYYIVTLDFLKKHKKMVLQGESTPFIIEDKFMIDIDEPEDLLMAEVLLKYRITK